MGIGDERVYWQQVAPGVWKDLKSGLMISGLVADRNADFNQAQKLCDQTNPKFEAATGGLKADWHVPSGYTQDLNDQHDNRDSEFITLMANGILKVVPGMSDCWFWSSSPSYDHCAFNFDGVVGNVFSGSRNRNDGSVLCVGHPM